MLGWELQLSSCTRKLLAHFYLYFPVLKRMLKTCQMSQGGWNSFWKPECFPIYNTILQFYCLVLCLLYIYAVIFCSVPCRTRFFCLLHLNILNILPNTERYKNLGGRWVLCVLSKYRVAETDYYIWTTYLLKKSYLYGTIFILLNFIP